jgi:hypothetical protein
MIRGKEALGAMTRVFARLLHLLPSLLILVVILV